MTIELLELITIGAQYGFPSIVVLYLLYERGKTTQALIDKIDTLITVSNTHMERISSGIAEACLAIKLMISEAQKNNRKEK